MQNNSSLHQGESVDISNKIWQFVRFAVITGLIFAVSFFAINYQSYKTIIASVLNPEAQEERGEILMESAESGGGDIDESLLLPVLNSEEGINDMEYDLSVVDIPVLHPDNRLVIPTTGQSVPINTMGTEHIVNKDWDGLEHDIQESLKTGVLFYPGAAKPGQMGNTFITGHSSNYAWADGNYNDVFALLGQLEVGDEYYVYYEQQKYTYRVIETKIVTADDVSILEQPSDKRISTLMTCWPVGTASKRMAVIAEDITDYSGIESSHSYSEPLLNESSLPMLPSR